MKTFITAFLLLSTFSAFANNCTDLYGKYSKYANSKWYQGTGENSKFVRVFFSDDSVKVRFGRETYSIGKIYYHSEFLVAAGGRKGEKEYAPLTWTPLMRTGEVLAYPFVAYADYQCKHNRYACMNKDYDSVTPFTKEKYPKFFNKMGTKVIETLSKIEITSENEQLLKCAEIKATELLND